MYKFLTKNGQLLAILLGVAVVAIFLITVFTGLDGAGYSVGDDLNQIMKDAPEGEKPAFDFFNLGLGLTIGLIVIAFIAALIFGLWQLITSPKQSLKGILAVVAIAAIFFAFYSTGVAEVAKEGLLDKHGVSDNVSKLISGGIWTTLMLLGGAFAIMILSEVRNLFK